MSRNKKCGITKEGSKACYDCNVVIKDTVVEPIVEAVSVTVSEPPVESVQELLKKSPWWKKMLGK
jgi:hypothetical protein